MRVIFWGTYDRGKPRVRIMLGGLRQAGVEVVEIHADVWAGIEDKGAVTGFWTRLRLLGRWLAAYPCLVYRYLRAPAHDAVAVGYLGHLDVLVLWPFARLRRKPVVWDAFLSLYDTIVADRRLIGPAHPLARGLRAWEWLACRAARVVVLDTRAQADYFAAAYGLAATQLAHVPVGAENEFFPAAPPPTAAPHEAREGGRLRVLFYGQFIPLQGIDTIVRAAQMTRDEPIDWTIAGRGQERGRMAAVAAEAPAAIAWIDWIDYRELARAIARADICLGIFGATPKAGRVIPNKVFQILAVGAPLITRDSPAIRELLSPDMAGVVLIPPGDPKALAEAVAALGAALGRLPRPLHREVAAAIAPAAIGAAWRAILADAVAAR